MLPLFFIYLFLHYSSRLIIFIPLVEYRTLMLSSWLLLGRASSGVPSRDSSSGLPNFFIPWACLQQADALLSETRRALITYLKGSDIC
jgi:hypothetical protein